MDELIPYEGQPSGKELPVFSRQVYLDRIGKLIYGELDPNDAANFEELYRRAYATFQHNQGKPITLEPAPRTIEELGRVTLEDLMILEADLSILFVGGFGVLCKALGRDPQKQWNREMVDEE